MVHAAGEDDNQRAKVGCWRRVMAPVEQAGPIWALVWMGLV
jgi:hypothetical protein